MSTVPIDSQSLREAKRLLTRLRSKRSNPRQATNHRVQVEPLRRRA